MPIASAGCGMAWQWIHRILCPMLYTIQYRDKYLHQRQQRKLKGGLFQLSCCQRRYPQTLVLVT